MNKMSRKLKNPANVGNAVKKAIRELAESEGSSVAGIIKIVSSLYQTSAEAPDKVVIREYLKNAVEKGNLLKLVNGKYKIKETARKRRSRSRSRSKGKSRRRSRSRKRSRGRRKRSRSGSRRRRRSSSGRRRKRSSSGKRRRRRRSKAKAEEE